MKVIDAGLALLIVHDDSPLVSEEEVEEEDNADIAEVEE